MDEVRLIDANALLKEIESFDPKFMGQPLIHQMARRALIEIVNKQPTFDCESDVHAYWVEDRFSYPICSNCGGDALCQALEEDAIKTDCCPHCGARMDKEVKR